MSECKFCETEFEKWHEIKLASGCTINDEIFVVDGLTLNVCPMCGMVRMSLIEIADHLERAEIERKKIADSM